MSENIAADLKGFTPTAPNRDALLFAAGRASAPRRRVWKWLTAGLVATNAVTLAVLFWPKPTVPVLPLASDQPPAAVEPAPVRPDPSSYIALTWGRDTEPPSDPGPAPPPAGLTPRAVNDPRFQ